MNYAWFRKGWKRDSLIIYRVEIFFLRLNVYGFSCEQGNFYGKKSVRWCLYLFSLMLICFERNFYLVFFIFYVFLCGHVLMRCSEYPSKCDKCDIVWFVLSHQMGTKSCRNWPMTNPESALCTTHNSTSHGGRYLTFIMLCINTTPLGITSWVNATNVLFKQGLIVS